MLTVLLVHGV